MESTNKSPAGGFGGEADDTCENILFWTVSKMHVPFKKETLSLEAKKWYGKQQFLLSVHKMWAGLPALLSRLHRQLFYYNAAILWWTKLIKNL